MKPHTRHILDTFLTRNPGLDLLRFDFNRPGAIDNLDSGDGDREATVETLKTFQRLLRVYPSHSVAAALDEAGLRSAHEIAAIPEHRFVREYAKRLDGRDGKTSGDELARDVHRRAASVVERVRLHAMSLATLADPVLASMPADNVTGLLNFYNGLPGYQELFGNLNYLQCENCQSIWSPAAYLVDLLRLADGYITKPENEQLSLAARRPDLWEIPLNCESTNQELPYLQIVNQILEAQVKARLKKPPLTGIQPTGARCVLSFDGSSTFIEFYQNPFLLPDYNNSPTTYTAPTQFTICAWVNPALLNPSTGLLPIMGWINSDTAQNKPTLYIDQNTTNLVAELQAETPTDAAFTHTSIDFFTSANVWVHVAWVFDLSTKQSTIYRNGIQFGAPQTTGDITAIYSDQTTTYQIGSAAAKYWEGMTANVGIWLRALEPREILSVMKSEGLPESQSLMASYWLIDDNSTTIANSAPYPIANQILNGAIGGTGQWQTLSQTSAESFLSANPVLSEQPLLYLAMQDYPFKLPFNHPLVQIRRLLAHFDTTLAELYAAFLVGNDKKDKPASIARESLELSPEKYNLLTAPMTETSELQQAYGLITEGAGLSELSDSGIFLEQTGLNDDQLNDLLFQNLRRKRALEFNGSLEVSIGNPPAMQALTGDLTIEMWLRPADFTEARNPLCKAFAGELAVTQEIPSGSDQSYLNFYFGVAGVSGTDLYEYFTIEPNFLNLHQWSHVAIVRDLSNTKTLYAYVDGALQATQTTTYPVAVASTKPVLIGAGYVDAYVGQIADVRLWNTARTEDEIKADMRRRLKGDEQGLAGCWPLDDGIGTTARDLSINKNYGTIQGTSQSLTRPPAWPLADNLVWDDNEINAQIMSQFFINQGLSSGQYLSLVIVDGERAIVVADPAAGTITPLTDEGTLDRLNRFIRLAQSLGWSFADLDLALRSIQPPPDTQIDEKAIRGLAAIKRLRAKLGLKVDELCALWSNMNTFGIGNGAAAEDLFDHTFNYPTSFADPTGKAGTPPYRPYYEPDPLYNDPPIDWSPKDRETPQANSTRARLRGALGVDDDGLSLISDFILDAQTAEDESSTTIQLNVPTLSKFYRYTTLARTLNLPVGQLLFLLRLLEITDIDSIEQVIKIVDSSEWMQSTGLNVAQLEYMTTGKPNRWVDPGYDSNAVASLLESMFQESQSLRLTPSSFAASGISQDDAEKIFQQLQADGAIDQNGVVLKQPVEQAFGPEPLSRQVLEFDGASTYISMSYDPFIVNDEAVSQFTICAWVNPVAINETSDTYVCGMKDNDDGNDVKPAMFMPASTADLTLYVGGLDANSNPSNFSHSANGFFMSGSAWTHIAWVFDVENKTSTLYRNGEPFGSSSQINLKQIYTSSSGYNIGAMSGSQLWHGEIANFAVWQRALVRREIISAMHATALPKDDIGLTACWLIDDDSSTGGVIKDSAGSNDGTLNGAANWITARDVLGQEDDSNLLDLFIRETLTVALASQDFYVTQKLAAFFNVSTGLMAAAQALAFNTHSVPLLHINRLLIDFSSSDPVPDDVNELIAALAVDLYLSTALGLSPGEVGGIARQPVAFNITEPGSSSSPDSFQWTIINILAVSEYKKLVAAFDDTAGELIDYFNLTSNKSSGFAEAARAKLADITGWPVDQIALLESQEFWHMPHTSPLKHWQFDTVEQVTALKRCFDMAAVLGAGIDLMLTLRQLNTFELGAPGSTPSVDTWESYQAAAHDLSQVVGAKYGSSVSPQVMSRIEGNLEQLKRDVLVAFLLWELSFTYDDIRTSDDLYDFLLIDVDMSSVVHISRLKAALNSLQLYVESTRMNLEAEVMNRIPRLWWSWMSSYRVWQANREVFVYPENYVDPALRRSETPPFEQLETDLQQASLTPATVESSIANYLEAFSEVANLEIVASYRAQVETRSTEAGAGQAIDTVFLFGRTRTNPPTFYHRTLRLFDGSDVEQGVWTPWQQINLSINAEKITPIYAFEKLFIFWVEQSAKSVNVTSGSSQQSYTITTANIYFSFQKLDRSWAQPQTLEQNLPINVVGPDITQYTNLDTELWRQVQAMLDENSGRMIILYGGLITYIPSSITAPSRTSNAEIDAYNYMVYESLLFAQSILSSGYKTSVVPLWTLGSTLSRDRVNLKLNAAAENYCTGMLAGVRALSYIETSFVDSLAIYDYKKLPLLFYPLNGNVVDVMTGNQPSGAASYQWTTDPTCPLGADRSVLYFPATNEYLSESFEAWSGDFSAEIWIKLSAFGNAYILSISGYSIMVDPTDIYPVLNGFTTSYTPTITATYDWTYLAITVDMSARVINFYSNGEYVGQMETQANTIEELQMGGFEGSAANISVWERILSAEEISARYSQAQASIEATLPLLTTGISAFASRVEPVGNQPGWFTFDNGDEAFLVTPLIPGTNSDPTLDVFKSLQQITTVTETAPTGSGRGVNRPAITITFGDAAVDSSTFSFSDLELKFTRITTNTPATLQQRFFIGGPDMLLSLESQLTPELPFTRFTPSDSVIAPSSSILDFDGAYGQYFWELFFYAPFLIANTLKTNQRFQMAQKWYQYIFNPTEGTDSDGLIGYWPLEGNADDMVSHVDTVLNAKAEPIFPEMKFADGSIRQVFYSPDQNDNNVNVPGGAELSPTAAITLEGWCNLIDLGSDDSWIIQKEVDGDFDDPWYVYRLSVKKGVFTFSLSINGVYVSVTSGDLKADLNEWYYVAGTFDESELILYLNGQQIASQQLSDFKPTITKPWAISTSGKVVVLAGDTFYGALAEARIWNKALSAETILEHYIAPQPQDRFWRFRPFLNRSVASLGSNLTSPQQLAVYNYDPFDPDAIARLRSGSYEKAIMMRYIENIVKWGNNLFAQYTWETITEATMLYTEALDLLGPAPRKIGDMPAPPVKTALDFVKEYGSAADIPEMLVQLENGITNTPLAGGQQLPQLPFNLLNSYFCVPVNKQLLALWEVIDNQLYKIRHGENIQGQPQPLPLFEPPLNPAALVKASGNGLASSSRPPSGSPTIPYFRFSYLIAQAKDFTSQVIQLGSSLLGALERQDGEQLALIQNTDEATILNLTTQIKQNQIDQLEQTTQSLQAALAAAQQRQQTYASWLQGSSGSNGNNQSSTAAASWSESLSTAEDMSLGMLNSAAISHSEALLTRMIASPLFLIPNIFGLADGGMSFGGSTDAVAGALDARGAILGIKSQVTGMVAQFQRRDQEWLLQYQLASDDVAQVQAQIEANQTAISSAQRELEIHQQQIAQNQAIGNFYKTKFTSEQLYQWMAGQISTVYYQSYQLAFDLAQQAQMAFQYEKNSQKNYLNYSAWDSAEKGLTAGDSLMLSLNQLDKAYIEASIRHLEIEKTISLLQSDPQAVIALKTTGKCSFSLTERMFDFDFPGHYNRKITSVSITIPAIVGPYQNIHATLRQTSSRVVLQPDIAAVIYLLPGGEENSSPPLSIRSNWNVNQQVALSRGTDDSGLFVLDFNDPRYLPFEGTGAISTWTLEMPQAANSIDFNSISDIIIKLNYTAQDGGNTFRSNVINQSAIQNYSAFRFISLRQSFPEAWYSFTHSTASSPTLQFPIARAMFPVNLEPGSIKLGTQKTIKQLPAGIISMQWLTPEGYDTTGLPDLTLNGQGVINNTNYVQLAAPGKEPTGQALSLSDFGVLNPNTLAASAAITEQVTDVILIIPFTGKLNWPSESS